MSNLENKKNPGLGELISHGGKHTEENLSVLPLVSTTVDIHYRMHQA